MSNRSTRLYVLHTAFYWLGVILAVGCGLIILVDHTTLLHRLEPEHMPSALLVGALAVLAFAVGEYFDSLFVKSNEKDGMLEPTRRRSQTVSGRPLGAAK